MVPSSAAERGSGGDRIARVGGDEQRWPVAATDRALEACRYLDAEQHAARAHQMVHLGFRMHHLAELEVGGVAECGEDRAPDVGILIGEHRGRQMARGGVDGEAEERELDERDEDHGAERQTIAPELQELLDEHRNGARKRAWPGVTVWAQSSEVVLRSRHKSMNTSSRDGGRQAPVDFWLLADACRRRVERRRIAPGNVEAGPEWSNHVDAWHADELLGEAVDIRAR